MPSSSKEKADTMPLVADHEEMQGKKAFSYRGIEPRPRAFKELLNR
jgi:hypothetical protein